MASNLQIPESGRKSLYNVFALKKPDFDKLIQGLSEISGKLGTRADLVTDLEKNIKILSTDLRNGLANGIVELYAIRHQHELSLDTLCSDVVSAMSGYRKGSKAKRDDKKLMYERTRQLLTLESIDKWTNAYDQLTNYERAFKSAHIQTDMRPIYSGENAKEIAGIVIVHNLGIKYVEDGETDRMLYLALDTNDVNILIRNLQNAADRVEGLEQKIKTIGEKYFYVPNSLIK